MTTKLTTEPPTTPAEPAPVVMERIEHRVVQPPKPDRRALYGLLGEISMVLHAYTGLDLAGLYRCLTNAVGNVIGPNVFTVLDNGPRQQTHLGDVIVGPTAAGKDRIYLAVLDHVMVHVDETWRTERFFENVRSDAALVHLVHDDILDDAGRVKVNGVVDTRTWMVEREFSRLLKDMKRPEAALSEQVRKSLDGPYLGNTTKTAALNERATRAHIGWICLTTPTDLTEHLDSSSLANGLANRFRFTYIQEGAPTEHGDLAAELNPLIKKLTGVVERARGKVGLFPLDNDVASALRQLDQGVREHLRPEGLAGDMEARFMPQVMREALILALVDDATAITGPPFVATLIDRLHVAQTNRMLFGGRTGSSVADEVLAAVARQAPESMTLTDLHREFSNNFHAGQLRSALRLLSQQDLVEGFKGTSTTRGGRRPEIWQVTSKGLGQSGGFFVSSSVDRCLRALLHPSPRRVANGFHDTREPSVPLTELLANNFTAEERYPDTYEETNKPLQVTKETKKLTTTREATPRKLVRKHRPMTGTT